TLQIRPQQIAPLLLLLVTSGAQAESSIWYRSNDPLAVETLAPPMIPQDYLDPARGFECAAPDYGSALTLADVVNSALCNNPQTREAWASARQQAAQLGIARSAYLP